MSDMQQRVQTTLKEVLRLHQVEDEPETPYDSKYKARELLKSLLDECKKTLPDVDKPVAEMPIGTRDILGRIEHLLGVNHVDTEELSTGEQHLERALELLAHDEYKNVCELCESLNSLGTLWSNRGEHKKALPYLERAVALFEAYSQRRRDMLDEEERTAAQTTPSTASAPAAASSGSAVTSSPESVTASSSSEPPEHKAAAVDASLPVSRWAELDLQWQKLNSIHTHTFFYMAQLYGHLKDSDTSAKYCHLTLNRQLESKEFNTQEWGANCMQLAVYYINHDHYRQAQHLLQAADAVIKKSPPLTDDDERLIASVLRVFGSLYQAVLTRSADLLLEQQGRAADASKTRDERTQAQQRATAKHASHHHKKKKKHHGDHAGKTAAAPDAPAAAPTTAAAELEPPLLIFESLKLPAPDHFPDATTFEQARAYFLKGLIYFEKALKMFVLEGFVSEHVPIQQDVSALYKQLAVFEPDLSRRCKMHKRRIDALKPLAEQLTPSIYRDFCRQLNDEVARAHGEMVDLKLALQRSEKKMDDPDATMKINQLALQGIQHHMQFLQSFDAECIAPNKLDPFYHHAYLSARFSMARLMSQIFSPDTTLLLEAQRRALVEYKALLQWAEDNKVQGMDAELELCRQMVQLIPLKMEQIKVSKTPMR